MFFLIYVSSATVDFSSSQLSELLTISRRNNQRDAISGMLLYKGGNFMQVLEGEESVVRRVHARIAADVRHRGLITLLQGPQAGREFSDWSMGFINLAPDQPVPPGYSEFLRAPLTGAEFSSNPTRAQRLLLTFKQSM